MLDVQNLDLHYGQSQILFDVSFDAPRGEITTLIGNNGVGKTSLLKAVAGRHPASGGTVTLNGTAMTLTSPFKAAHAGIAYVPQGREVFPMMSVAENLETGFACLPKSDHHVPDMVFALSSRTQILPMPWVTISLWLRVVASRGAWKRRHIQKTCLSRIWRFRGTLCRAPPKRARDEPRRTS